MLYITGRNGQTEMLIDYKNVQRKHRVNGEHSLSFDVINTDEGAYAYQLIEERAQITDKYGDNYIIMHINKRGHYSKSVQAIHIFFDNMINTYQYDVLNGTINFKKCLDFIFKDTGWTYVIQGAFASHEFQNFGDDTSSALLQKALNEYGAEFQIDNKNYTVTFKNQIGNVVDAQFRYGHNLKTFEEEIDFYNFATFIKGFTKDDAGKDVFVEYRSPLAKVYGDLPQKPVRDERYKSASSLLERCKKELNDTPDIKFKVSVANLFDNGLSPLHKYDCGDYVYMIYDLANVRISIRIVEIVDDPTNPKKPPIVELSTFKQLKTMSAIQAQFQQTQKQVAALLDDGGNLNLALKRLYMNTETFADNTGVWYVDPEDGGRYVHIGAGGLDVHKGLIRVERDDGFAVIVGGVIQHGFDIAGHQPPFTHVNVGVEGWWWTTTDNVLRDCQFYSYEHKTRYLKVQTQIYTESGGEVEVALISNDGSTILQKISSTQTSAPAIGGDNIITHDMGVPDGALNNCYFRIRNKVAGKKAYARILRVWLEG